MPELLRNHQFHLLLKHLLHRFFNNEMLSVEGEILPLMMTVAGALAVPTLIVAVFLFPSYHAFPPRPLTPSFWTQVCEHYFFLVYSMVAMGLVTVFEADLLFPSQLDILILSPLPISARRLIAARVLASVLFLALFLLGMNSLGLLAYPPITELHVRRLFIANFTAVLAAGTFSCATFVAVQALMICTLPDRTYRKASLWLQCTAVAILLTIFLSMPKSFPVLNTVTANLDVARWLPPLWFLGVYECILAGPARLPQFLPLARLAYWTTPIAVLLVMALYPIAYRRRTRQAIEGPGPESPNQRSWNPLHWVLDALIIRTPEQRAVFHFLGQSLRMPSVRLYIALYAGIGIALLISSSIQLQHAGERIFMVVPTSALETALPVIGFWVVGGLCWAFSSSSDHRAGWVFRVTGGEPSISQLNAVRSWVAVHGSTAVTGAAVLFVIVEHWFRHDWHGVIVGWIVSIGACWIVADLLLVRLSDIPFVQPRPTVNTDLAGILLRYIVLLPVVVAFAALYQKYVGFHVIRETIGIVAMLALHRLLRYFAFRSAQHRPIRSDTMPLTDILPGLGLEGFCSASPTLRRRAQP